MFENKYQNYLYFDVIAAAANCGHNRIISIFTFFFLDLCP
jgi:hypothetical protein